MPVAGIARITWNMTTAGCGLVAFLGRRYFAWMRALRTGEVQAKQSAEAAENFAQTSSTFAFVDFISARARSQ
jgi:hypothetical protein